MRLNTVARFAGLLYLGLIFFGVFAQFSVRASLIVTGDTITTINNITANEWLFRLGFLADMVMMTLYFFLVMTLYQLFKGIGGFAALSMVLAVVISIAIMMLNVLHYFSVLILLSGAEYLAGFDTKTLNALIMFFLDLHKYGYLCAQIFFGLWLFPLGYLGYKSGYMPKILGILLMIACVTYQIDFIVIFLFPTYQVSLTPILTGIAGIAEFALCFWLMIRGANQAKTVPSL